MAIKCTYNDEQVVDIVLYLEFQNAFDKVPHKRIVKKMHGYGIRAKVLDSFQTERLQTTVSN